MIRSAADNHVGNQCSNADRADGTRRSESQGGQAAAHGVSDELSRSIDLTRRIQLVGTRHATANDIQNDDTRERRVCVRGLSRCVACRSDRVDIRCVDLCSERVPPTARLDADRARGVRSSGRAP